MMESCSHWCFPQWLAAEPFIFVDHFTCQLQDLSARSELATPVHFFDTDRHALDLDPTHVCLSSLRLLQGHSLFWEGGAKMSSLCIFRVKSYGTYFGTPWVSTAPFYMSLRSVRVTNMMVASSRPMRASPTTSSPARLTLSVPLTPSVTLEPPPTISHSPPTPFLC
jgi:hypothetical protein